MTQEELECEAIEMLDPMFHVMRTNLDDPRFLVKPGKPSNLSGMIIDLANRHAREELEKVKKFRINRIKNLLYDQPISSKENAIRVDPTIEDIDQAIKSLS